MIKPAVLTMLLAGLAATPALADKVRFEGAAVITGITGTCSDWNPTGSRYYVRFRPAGLGDNGNSSGLSFFQLNGAMNFAVSGGKFTSTAKTVTYTAIYDFGGADDVPVKVKFSKQDPATLKTSSLFVDVTGAITNFDQMDGCTANFRFSATQRLE